MARDTFIDGSTEPKGKRTVRRNIYGTLQGYIGRTPWEEFGFGDVSPAGEQARADAWVAGRPDWRDADLDAAN